MHFAHYFSDSEYNCTALYISQTNISESGNKG